MLLDGSLLFVLAQHYMTYMKKQMESKTLAVRVPIQVFNKFKERCDKEGFRMSEILRLYMGDFATNGPSGAVAALKEMLSTTQE